MNTIFFYRTALLSFLTIFIIGNSLAQQEYKVLDRWNFHKNAQNALYDHYAGIAFELLKQRKINVDQIESVEQVLERQAQIQKHLKASIGDFPAKTPLNAQITRSINKEKYIIEHVIYESQPGFHVTASVFKPKGLSRRAKLPVVIYCSGHNASGYRSPIYLHKILNLVHKGFMVLAFDPVSQGERLQYIDEGSARSKIGGPTKEHSYAGAQAFIAGSSQAKYMIWDGIRTVDYLLSRKDVDPERIGITGRSGGGTQSAYIAAFDERIYAVAPECYITSFTRLLQSIGPQDAEQNLKNFIEYGLDHADFLWVRAPKPAMIIATTNDFFSIQGARETASEVKKCYSLLGSADQFSMVEDVEGHASTRKNREAMYAFFQKSLRNEGSNSDVDYQLPTEAEMQVTKTGQVRTAMAGKGIDDLIKDEAQKYFEVIEKQRNQKELHLSQTNEYVRNLMHAVSVDASEEKVFTGKIVKERHVVERYILKGAGDYPIPCLWFKPNVSKGKVLLYLHPEGKSGLLQDSLALANLIDEGYSIMAPDLLGTGESFPKDYRGDAQINDVSYNLWFASILTGQSIAALRAHDVLRLTTMAKEMTGYDDVSIYAYGEMSPVALLASANDPIFNQCILEDALLSFQTLWKNTYYHEKHVHNCPAGIVEYTDIPDLIQIANVNKVVIHGSTDKGDEYFQSGAWKRDLEWLKSTSSKNKIIHSDDGTDHWIRYLSQP
ncbi:MAG: acetylxylan esterase [Cyclobacteriaceae bacterium]|nr:acetylxylan esterase [Cyclobacteriaceae bacterium]